MKKKNKGFTLAEMLIVVAIIGILVAIMSITISSALEKSREATDMANIRSGLSMIQTAAMFDEYDLIISNSSIGKDVKNCIGKVARVWISNSNYKGYVYMTAVDLKQKKKGWDSFHNGEVLAIGDKNLNLDNSPENKIFYFSITPEGSVNDAAMLARVWGLASK